MFLPWEEKDTIQHIPIRTLQHTISHSGVVVVVDDDDDDDVNHTASNTCCFFAFLRIYSGR